MLNFLYEVYKRFTPVDVNETSKVIVNCHALCTSSQPPTLTRRACELYKSSNVEIYWINQASGLTFSETTNTSR